MEPKLAKWAIPVYCAPRWSFSLFNDVYTGLRWGSRGAGWVRPGLCIAFLVMGPSRAPVWTSADRRERSRAWWRGSKRARRRGMRVRQCVAEYVRGRGIGTSRARVPRRSSRPARLIGVQRGSRRCLDSLGSVSSDEMSANAQNGTARGSTWTAVTARECLKSLK